MEISSRNVKAVSLESLGLKKKWNRRKGTSLWDEYVVKVVNDKREAFRRFLSTNKLEDKIEYHRKMAVAKHEVHKNTGKFGKNLYQVRKTV
jgi:hypothetical protein